MKLRRTLKRLSWGLALLVAIGAGVVLLALSTAKVELAASGVHQRLLVPLPRGAIGLRMYAGTGEDVFIGGFLAGPVVHREAGGRWSATWYCQDRLHRRTGDARVLQVDCAGKRHAFVLDELPVPAAEAPMPGRLVVLSDLEGNSRFLEAALRRLGIVDAAGQWQFGKGHFVVLGDSVDRGRDVFAVLWRLHGLAVQARAAGGAVHVLLGNHEQYLLRGNVSRADPEYRYALMQLGGYARAFAADTVLGAWLRRQPVVLKLGKVLFVHAGLSPQVAGSGLSLAQLNEAMRAYWREPGPQVARSPAYDAVLGRTGVTQYRGYFRGEEGQYTAATGGDIDRTLARFGADQVVVAHTLVERVKALHDGRVMAVDVNDDEARAEVLAYEHGKPRVVDLGLARGLDTRPPTRLREFSLSDAADREVLYAMIRAYRYLGSIPWPY
jgi:hypothetical protein